jgi:hypothetical protein
MQPIKTIFSVIFGGLIFLCIGLFLALGVAGLALKDLGKFLGRRFMARLRGERYSNKPRIYSHLDFPALQMNEDGFVEPPPSPGLPSRGGYGTRSSNALVAYSPGLPAQKARLSVVPQAQVTFKVLQFPADPVVRRAIRARSKAKPALIPAGGPKVVYLSHYLPRKKR